MIQLPVPHWPIAADTVIASALDVHSVGYQPLYTCPTGRIAKVIGGSIFLNADSPHCNFALKRGAAQIGVQGNANVIAAPDNTQQALLGQFYLEAGDTFGINVSVGSAGALIDVAIAVEEYSI